MKEEAANQSQHRHRHAAGDSGNHSPQPDSTRRNHSSSHRTSLLPSGRSPRKQPCGIHYNPRSCLLESGLGCALARAEVQCRIRCGPGCTAPENGSLAREMGSQCVVRSRLKRGSRSLEGVPRG